MMAWTSPALTVRLMPRRISLPSTLACRFLIASISQTVLSTPLHPGGRRQSGQIGSPYRLREVATFGLVGFHQAIQQSFPSDGGFLVAAPTSLLSAELGQRGH